LLDQQFFNNTQYKKFLNENFVLYHADTQVEADLALFEKYDVHSTPSVLIFGADLQEVDRLTGYNDNEQFKGELDRILRGENTIINLTLKIEENPNDLLAIAALAKKYHEAYAHQTARSFSSKILDMDTLAAKTFGPFGKDESEISVLEYAHFMECYGEWTNTKYFLEKYPESGLYDHAVGILGWLLRNSEDNAEILAYFHKLKEGNPKNKAILKSMVRYYDSIDELDKDGIRYTHYLLAGHIKTLESDELRMCASLFLKHGKLSEAMAAYGPAFSLKMIEEKNSDALNGYAWFWALKEENLSSALVSAKKAVEFSPEDANIWDTLSMVYWKMGDHQKAIETEEKALKLAGGEDEGYKDRIEKIRADMAG